jgi:hypothetical protein
MPLTIKGVEPERRYTVGFRLFDPKGEMRARHTMFYDVPRHLQPSFEWQPHITWSPQDPRNWDLGRWRVEIAVNGKVEATRTFEVVEWDPSTRHQLEQEAPRTRAPRLRWESDSVIRVRRALSSAGIHVAASLGYANIRLPLSPSTAA